MMWCNLFTGTAFYIVRNTSIKSWQLITWILFIKFKDISVTLKHNAMQCECHKIQVKNKYRQFLQINADFFFCTAFGENWQIGLKPSEMCSRVENTLPTS